MHIAYITHEYPPDTGKGGIGTYTLQMACAIKQAGLIPEIFTASLSRNISEEYNGILTHRVLVNNLKLFREMVVAIFSERHTAYPFDLIECPEIGGEAAFIREKFPEIPLIVRLHTPGVLVTRLQNTYVPLLSKLRFVIGALLRGKWDWGYWSKHDKNQFNDPDYLITEQASLITAPSFAMKNWAVKFWGINPAKIKVVPNPFVIEATPIMPDNANIHKTIAFIGRLNVLKGVVVLTEIIPAILKKYPDWKFLVIGNSEKSPDGNMDMLEWMKQKLKPYLQNIEFVGWIDRNDLPGYLSRTDIVLIPSLFESFSYVCAEAMAAGKAIVGSRNGGISELLNHDSGILVDPQNRTKIVKALNFLIENPEKRLEIGRNAHFRILTEFTSVKIAHEMGKTYESLLNIK